MNDFAAMVNVGSNLTLSRRRSTSHGHGHPEDQVAPALRTLPRF